MSEYQLEIKQVVDYPRCRIYRQFIQLLLKEKNIRINEEGTLLAVEPYHRKTFTSFSVPKDLYSYNGEMVVYSKSLCAVLYSRLDWNKDTSYRIPGKILKEKKQRFSI